jgi:hypothetical protein
MIYKYFANNVSYTTEGRMGGNQQEPQMVKCYLVREVHTQG